MSHLGDKLRELRGTRAIREVARGTGIVPIDITRYEQGMRVPTAVVLERLATYFEIPYAELRGLYFDDLFVDEQELEAILSWAKRKLNC